MENIKVFQLKIFDFYSRKKSLYIAWASFRNGFHGSVCIFMIVSVHSLCLFLHFINFMNSCAGFVYTFVGIHLRVNRSFL